MIHPCMFLQRFKVHGHILLNHLHNLHDASIDGCFVCYLTQIFLTHPRKGLPSVFWAECYARVKQCTGVLEESRQCLFIRYCWEKVPFDELIWCSMLMVRDLKGYLWTLEGIPSKFKLEENLELFLETGQLKC